MQACAVIFQRVSVSLWPIVNIPVYNLHITNIFRSSWVKNWVDIPDMLPLMSLIRNVWGQRPLSTGLVMVLIIGMCSTARAATAELADSRRSTTATPDQFQTVSTEQPVSRIGSPASFATNQLPSSVELATSLVSPRAVSRALLGSPSLQTAPFPTAPSPPAAASILIYDETDLAQQILAASGPEITTLMLPTVLFLTKALPLVVGPLELVAAGASSAVTCSSSSFTAMTVNASIFYATGLTFLGCGTVLKLQLSENGTDRSVTISNCNFSGNTIDPAAVSWSDPQLIFLACWVRCTVTVVFPSHLAPGWNSVLIYFALYQASAVTVCLHSQVLW